MTLKKCTICGIEKSLDFFNQDKKGCCGKKSICKDCEHKKSKQYYLKNKKQSAKWRIDNKEKCKLSQIKWKERHPDKHKATYLKYNRIRRLKVLEKVAGENKIVCVRCGCDFLDLLEIHHKNGGGNKEYKGQSQKFHTSILNGSRGTNDLEILCKLCNNLHYLETKFGKTQYELKWTNE